ncbi:MAG: hypothetical protein BM485_11360 [Desulfobulbaceae bacterium DB1]|nr:MAG: hypothetical protein BM485_11360 [Desulfobulbaceae bacterium DB1]
MNKKYDAPACYSLFFLISAFFALIILRYPVAYVWATYEDLLGEWTQFSFFAIAFFFSARLALSGSRFRIFFTALALACLYVCGEEISWGQRLFDVATPDFFSRHNLQQETNLHNFFTGPYSTTLKRLIELLLAGGFILYGILYPLQLRKGRKPALLLTRLGVPAPPLSLWPFFAAAALFELRIFSFNEAEVAEILLSLTLAIISLSYWQNHGSARQTLSSGPAPQAMAIILLFVLGTGLGATATAVCYQVPRLRADMEQRLEGGIRKFGERYGRYGSWQNAAGLYQRLHDKKPQNIEILRSLAACYKQMGRDDKFTELTTKAIRLDMTRYGRNPEDVQINLSLRATFQQAGYRDKADFHLQKALTAGKNQVRLEPYNAGAAYWLARSYLAAGDMDSALREMEKAVYLKPESTLYQKTLARLTLRQKYGPDEEETGIEG